MFKKLIAVAIAATTGLALTGVANASAHQANPAVATTTLVPFATPTGLQASPTPTGGALSWNAVPGIDSGYFYEIVSATASTVDADNPTTSVVVPLAAGSYYARVATHPDPTHDWSAWSPWVAFTVGPASSSSVLNTIDWSGYTWDVRPPTGNPSAPGPSYWDNTTKTVSVQPDGDLQMSIWYDGSHWRTGEVDNETALGYGTYKWVIDSDLSGQDINTVLGLFTYDGSSTANAVHSENDIEFAQWGSPTAPPLTYTVSPGGTGQQDFVDNVGSDAPYTATFAWSAGQAMFTLTGAGGEVIGSYTSTTGVQPPNGAVPIINWYTVNGDPTATEQTQTVDIRSFSFTPPAASCGS